MVPPLSSFLKLRRCAALAPLLALLSCLGAGARADEGMWLPTDPPRALLQERYGFAITALWLEHLQKSSVRFQSGGSGEFVSDEGLVLTNHHVGADTLQKLSTPGHDYVHDGFYAATRAEELKAPDLELNVLMAIEDVTERVQAAVAVGASDQDAFQQRRAIISTIEKEAQERTGQRCDVVTLYQGGRFHLYRYHRYTDVRVVFAPEQGIAFYGGDADNFEYPRYDLDICFFRAYEKGEPAKIEHYLRWSQAGTRAGDLVFVSGHPGHTDRLLTMAELAYLRDVQFPQALRRLYRAEVLLGNFSERSQENARRAQDHLFGVQNGRKACRGTLAGLLDPELFVRKAAAESALRAKIAAHLELREALGAYDRIAAAQKIIAENERRHALLERAQAFDSDLFEIARTLLRGGAERARPNDERLREYGESHRESLELELFSEKPIYRDLEEVRLADSLTGLAETLGADAPLTRAILNGQAPGARAAALIRGTQVGDVAFRRRLYAGGSEAVAAAAKDGDTMLLLAQAVDGEARAVRQIMETQEEARKQAHAQIARARFALEGTGGYPDATFTLRLAFGVVKGLVEGGEQIPAHTDFAGLYARSQAHENQPPFDLPPRWLEARTKLDLQTPLNFISTADIIGGNSGSPVVDRQGEFVGIIFDGNLQSLVLDVAYEETQARAVSVDSRGILEALRKVYHADALVHELGRP